jgi:ditrans,polycis-polyprenyl diphosphate synthase
MDMAKVKLTHLAQHGELLEQYGAKMQFLGQRDMIRADVLEQVDKAIDMTKGNGRYVNNHFIAYLANTDWPLAAVQSSTFVLPTHHEMKSQRQFVKL